MELKVGMYARTEDGNILKIKGIEDVYTSDDMYVATAIYFGDCFHINSDEIIKSSLDIIDLIEVGDVIIDKEGHKYPINYEFETDYNSEYESYEITIDDNITLFFKDGLSIVTKEQFESMSYKVGD